MPITEDISFIVREADERFFGKTVAESQLRARWGLDLIGVKRPKLDGAFSVYMMPDADFRLLGASVRNGEVQALLLRYVERGASARGGGHLCDAGEAAAGLLGVRAATHSQARAASDPGKRHPTC